MQLRFLTEIDRKKLEEKLQEVRVDAQRVPEQLLSEVTVPQRSQKKKYLLRIQIMDLFYLILTLLCTEQMVVVSLVAVI